MAISWEYIEDVYIYGISWGYHGVYTNHSCGKEKTIEDITGYAWYSLGYRGNIINNLRIFMDLLNMELKYSLAKNGMPSSRIMI